MHARDPHLKHGLGNVSKPTLAHEVLTHHLPQQLL